uniref:Histidine ammonia-lyase n=1 Tax=Ditylenchus dipsaci TaxID=166011 RepID=A0A915EF11_9BILA
MVAHNFLLDAEAIEQDALAAVNNVRQPDSALAMRLNPQARIVSESDSADSMIGIEQSATAMESSTIGTSLPNEKRLILLDGYNLSVEDLVDCFKDLCYIKLSETSKRRIREARLFLEKIAAEHRIVYGITTGFGTFANVEILPAELKQLQLNLIRSHATGYGDPLSPAKARMLLALRINVLAKGHSGISVENVEKLVAAFNAFCVSFIPEQGTVGCSGDLCPLAHLALGLLGEGQMWSPSTGWAPAAHVLQVNGLEKMVLGAKEGLALINGTQMVSAIGSMALLRAENIAKQADVIAALTLDVLKGTSRAYDANIHRVRPHKGQNIVAGRLRALLHSDLNRSEIAESHRNCGKVQDAYTLRCVPQVHGVVHDTIEFAKSILTTEINSATDNPLIFAELEEIISGGNFHGEYPAKALDYLAIAVHELAQISERRLERLVNHELSGLPTFLTRNGGLNSGFMTIQLCAASLVSENKVLCHPSSADSIPTSCNQEDHVSMGGFSARKALKIVEHTEAVLAMELMAACQGMEFLKPLKSTKTLQKVYDLVRTVSPALEEDRFMHPEIQEVIELVRQNKIWEVVEPHLTQMSQLESYHPQLLRQEAESPTASALGQLDFSRVLSTHQ